MSNLQDSNYHNKVEQAQEPLPLADPTFEPIIPPPKSLHNNSFYPFQPEVFFHKYNVSLMHVLVFCSGPIYAFVQ